MSTSDNSDLIEVERRCALDTKNPMHVSAAYKFARVVGAPVPEWVLRYLDQASSNLMELASETQNGKNLGPKIAKAFYLAGSGRGSPLVDYHHDWLVFGANVRHRMKRGDKPYLAIESVARDAGVSYSAVERAWKKYDRLFPGDAIFPDEALS